jgi:hypothetical protein
MHKAVGDVGPPRLRGIHINLITAAQQRPKAPFGWHRFPLRRVAVTGYTPGFDDLRPADVAPRLSEYADAARSAASAHRGGTPL